VEGLVRGCAEGLESAYHHDVEAEVPAERQCISRDGEDGDLAVAADDPEPRDLDTGEELGDVLQVDGAETGSHSLYSLTSRLFPPLVLGVDGGPTTELRTAYLMLIADVRASGVPLHACQWGCWWELMEFWASEMLSNGI